MSTLNDDAPVGLTDTVSIPDALRQVADWLDQHPEIAVDHAFVPVQASGRTQLEDLAAALGDRATEQVVTYNDDVEITGWFGTVDKYGRAAVRVYAHLPISKLTDEPPAKPKYEPIIKTAAEGKW